MLAVGARLEAILLLLPGAALLACRLVQVYAMPVPDFDTAWILATMGHLGFREAIGTDTGHPGGLTLLVAVLRMVTTWLAAPPAVVWCSVVAAGLVANTAALAWVAHQLSGRGTVASATAVLYLASPVVGDLGGRAEESLVWHLPFIAACWLILRPAPASPGLLAGLGVTLAALHLQPFVIATAGLLGRVDGRAVARRELASATGPGAFLGGGLAWLVAALAGRPPVNYASQYFSVVNNDGLGQYVHASLLFAQGYLVTGTLPFRYTAHGIVPLGAWGWLGLGVVAAVIAGAIVVGGRGRALLLAALAFVLLYEPSSSERWDTLLIPLVLAGAAAVMRVPALRWVAAGVLTLNLAALPGAADTTTAALREAAAMRRALAGLSEVHACHQDLPAIIGVLPHSVRLVALAGDARPALCAASRLPGGTPLGVRGLVLAR